MMKPRKSTTLALSLGLGLGLAACGTSSPGTSLMQVCTDGMCPAGYECMDGFCVPIGGDTTGDGDTDTGDGDTDTGDGDGDTTTDTGDGDGDTTGDGDGDTTGDGDGDTTGGAECGADPGWGQVAIGQPIKHAMAIDHNGNERNICEFAGVPIAIDLSAFWCGPCHMASDYLANGAGGDPFGGIGPQLRGMIDDGSAVWLTYVVQDDNGAPSTVANAATWDELYHHANIPVLAEGETQELTDYLAPGCWPTAWVVDPELNFFGLDDCQSWNQLAQMVNTFGG